MAVSELASHASDGDGEGRDLQVWKTPQGRPWRICPAINVCTFGAKNGMNSMQIITASAICSVFLYPSRSEATPLMVRPMICGRKHARDGVSHP